jgi:hypothetical protein
MVGGKFSDQVMGNIHGDCLWFAFDRDCGLNRELEFSCIVGDTN